MKWVADFTVDRLVASGKSLPDARRIVGKKLTKCGVRPARKGSTEGSGEVTERTIKKWQEDIAAEPRGEAARERRMCEEGQASLVLGGLCLTDMPDGTTPDTLELERLAPVIFQRKYLGKLAKYVLVARLAEPKKTT
jgi:hypothetical protein